MLPMPAITCWSSSNAFSCAVGERSARSSGRVEPVGDGSTPSLASSGSSTARWSGSNTTTSPNVRGSTNQSSSARGRRGGHDVGVRRARASRRRRAAPGRSSAGGSSPRRRCRAGRQVLAPPAGADDRRAGQPVDQRLADVRRTLRSRPTSTRVIRRPTTWPPRPRRTVSTSGSSGMATALSRPRRRGRMHAHRRRPARPASSSDPRPRRATRRRRRPWRRSAWRGRDRHRDRTYTGATSYRRALDLLQQRLVVEMVEAAIAVVEPVADEALDQVVAPPPCRHRGRPRR